MTGCGKTMCLCLRNFLWVCFQGPAFQKVGLKEHHFAHFETPAAKMGDSCDMVGVRSVTPISSSSLVMTWYSPNVIFCGC